MRRLAAAAVLLIACGPPSRPAGSDAPGVPQDAPLGACGNAPPPTIKGTVYAPNGTLPLYGVNVYVPNAPLPPFTEGAQCSRCTDPLPAETDARVRSDEGGHFVINNPPTGDNIPLVITTGKWRRQIVIPHVAACGETMLSAAETRLPSSQLEGELPKIAITTGDADTLECIVRKLGIADTEITTNTGTGRVHLYRGDGVESFQAGFAGGTGPIPSAVPLWNSTANLSAYDIVMLSCEGTQLGPTSQKTQLSLDAMKAYADLGGRVFATHWQNIWIGGNFLDGNPGLKPAVWDTIATWSATDLNSPILDRIDEVSNPKGVSFATWMLHVMGSTTHGTIPLLSDSGRSSAATIDTTRVERWVYTADISQRPQMFQFSTPLEQPPEQRCGKVVFTDMHVSGSPQVPLAPYPAHCVGGASLTPQEKALAFMFFDIATCVGPIF